ncbi:MAG: 23S rRNA pseudouridine2457 synthase [Akkermansiaceae bacterium]|jgi:23S rRNA pseudouridine2457 synthase
MLIAFNKPYGVLSQFNANPGDEGQRTLKEFGFPPKCLPLGRLDMDSEGLLLFTDEKSLEDRLLNPRYQHRRRYLVLVEGVPDEAALTKLRSGTIVIKGHTCRPCRAKSLKQAPPLPARNPPVRVRQKIIDTWIRLELREGKNRQVRRMTAAVGLPCLRLLREGIGAFPLGDLPVGEWKELNDEERTSVFAR